MTIVAGMENDRRRLHADPGAWYGEVPVGSGRCQRAQTSTSFAMDS
jgi:hypothetical protein